MLISFQPTSVRLAVNLMYELSFSNAVFNSPNVPTLVISPVATEIVASLEGITYV